VFLKVSDTGLAIRERSIRGEEIFHRNVGISVLEKYRHLDPTLKKGALEATSPQNRILLCEYHGLKGFDTRQ
jgi:hypothetical protein